MASKTKTKSTGRRARSNRRKRRLDPATIEKLRGTELDQTKPWMRLPEATPKATSEDPGPRLKVRPEPPEPTPGEQTILDLLWREFDRSDDVARAAARFETDVHEQLVQRRITEGFSEDEAGDVHRVFRAEEFNNIYRRLLMLRMERALIKDLDLIDYEADIMRERIHAVFGPSPPPKTKSITVDDQLHIGSAETQQVQNLKERGRRRR